MSREKSPTPGSLGSFEKPLKLPDERRFIQRDMYCNYGKAFVQVREVQDTETTYTTRRTVQGVLCSRITGKPLHHGKGGPEQKRTWQFRFKK
jgi:hypothetical protein